MSAPFSGRAFAIVMPLAAVSLLVGILLGIFGKDLFGTQSSQSDSYSRSAIGHHAFVELLVGQGRPVLRRAQESVPFPEESLLILAEPVLGPDASAQRRRVLELLPLADIVVLPKWEGQSVGGTGQIDFVRLRPVEEVTELLDEIGLEDAQVVRLDGDGERLDWKSDVLVGKSPSLSHPQLIVSDEITPVVYSDAGILVGWIHMDYEWTLILSDPDLIQTHGLGDGDDGVLALGLFDLFDPGVVVFDETIHGHLGGRSVWRRLFDLPLVFVTVQVLLVVGMLLWSGAGRFGSPRRVAPHLAAGKELLIANTARLLRFHGHSGHTLVAYLRNTARDVVRNRHGRTLGKKELAAWVRGIEDGRGMTLRLRELELHAGALATGRSREGAVLRAARDVHQWKQEMKEPHAPR